MTRLCINFCPIVRRLSLLTPKHLLDAKSDGFTYIMPLWLIVAMIHRHCYIYLLWLTFKQFRSDKWIIELYWNWYFTDSWKLKEKTKCTHSLCHMTVVEAKRLALFVLQLTIFSSFNLTRKSLSHGTRPDESLAVAVKQLKRRSTSSLLSVGWGFWFTIIAYFQTFSPLITSVDMLEVVNVPTQTGGVECWMDIQIGNYPKITPIDGHIKIGQNISVLVYLKDPPGEYDLVVKDCYAYDNEDYGAKSTGKLQLSDGNGCSRKRKLFGSWQKSTSTGNSGATLVLYNTLYAFKFPDKAQVFLKCDIEVNLSYSSHNFFYYIFKFK